MSEIMAVYLDYNATTPLAPSVCKKITESLSNEWGNPSSSHAQGFKAMRAIEEARSNVAEMIGAEINDIIFTSGGTEANNMVILGVRDYYESWKKLSEDTGVKPHVITTVVEHDSIILPLRKLEQRGDIELSLVPMDENGCVIVEQVVSYITPATCLITIMLANNETGVVMPLKEIARRLKEVNAQRATEGLIRILLHTDAAQVIGKMKVTVSDVCVDYLTIVGHKFYGPRIGALYVRGRKAGETPIYPLLYGGGQESGLRPGTPNTPMIVGLGEAARLVRIHLQEYQENMTQQRDHLEKMLQLVFEDKVTFNCRAESNDRLPNTSSVCLVGDGPELHGYNVLAKCRLVLGSVGAACHDQMIPSSILIASGVSECNALNTIRLSVGRDTTEEDIDAAVLDLSSCLTNKDLAEGHQ